MRSPASPPPAARSARRWRSSRGAIVEWRKLQWLPADQSVSRGHFDFPEPVGRQRMVRYPAGEQVTVPRHVSTRRVRTIASAATLMPSRLNRLLPLLTRPAGLAMRTPLKRMLDTAISRMPEGPDEADRAAVRFTIVCDVVRGRVGRRGVITGNDVYGLTAALAARAGIAAARGAIGPVGGLAPSQAFEPRGFLREFERFGLEWRAGGRARSAVAVAA